MHLSSKSQGWGKIRGAGLVCDIRLDVHYLNGSHVMLLTLRVLLGEAGAGGLVWAGAGRGRGFIDPPCAEFILGLTRLAWSGPASEISCPPPFCWDSEALRWGAAGAEVSSPGCVLSNAAFSTPRAGRRLYDFSSQLRHAINNYPGTTDSNEDLTGSVELHRRPR